LRIQGGANAIIIDPAPGDIGICVFASRDISKVQTTKNQANPGSFRQYSFSDGMYLGGVLNGVPAQYIQFNTAGITITSPVILTIDCNVQVNGTITATGDVIGNNISLDNHVHTGVSAGGADTGKPTG
jgi:phage baseplate assembly protein gpV